MKNIDGNNYAEDDDAITQPDKLVFVSQYFRCKWLRALGPLGTAIVIYLRGACYHNRKTGETRDRIQLSQKEIATGCGSSVPTIKREFERNEALRRFVQVRPAWTRDSATGRVRQLENTYKVRMTDPLIEADKPRLRQMAGERSGAERTAQTPPAPAQCKPIHRKGPAVNRGSLGTPITVGEQQRGAVMSPDGQYALPGLGDQNELPGPVDQNEPSPVQSELLSEESLLKTTRDQTLNVRQTAKFAGSDRKRSQPETRRDDLETAHMAAATAIVEELRDWGSERRHKQLISICDQHCLGHLVEKARASTRARMAREAKRGPLEKPGAYYQSVLIKLLEGHQIFVPKAGDDDPDEVRRLARESLGLEEGSEQV